VRRRDVLKGAALAAAGSFVSLRASASKGEAKTVQTLTSERYSGKTGRLSVELHVYPDKDGKLRERFRELVEDWEARNWDLYRPIEAVSYEPLMEDGEPWLVHEAWKPISKDNLSTLFTPSMEIFRNHRWDLIERAVNLRENGYWRQEYLPKAPRGLDGGGMSPATAYWLTFKRVVRKRLHKVVVRFEAVPLADIRRYLGVTSPEYDRLEENLVALEALRNAGKLTPRAYYELRIKRLDRLEELETEFLS